MVLKQTKIARLLLLICLPLSSCHTFTVTNKVHLKDFPKISSVGSLNVYEYVKMPGDARYGFKEILLVKPKKEIKSSEFYPKDGCVLDVEKQIENNGEGFFLSFYLWIYSFSFFPITLEQKSYTVKGKLIDIKTGDALADYRFKENVAKKLFFNPILAPLSLFMENHETFYNAAFVASSKIDQALYRQVTNDVHYFEACGK